tara:strand:+ start:1239 stop:1649 length:411 start_codon:yes stop_codon:yes gene_type:complete
LQSKISIKKMLKGDKKMNEVDYDYSEVANIGDYVKAWNFEPREGRSDSYLIGKVIDKVSHLNGDVPYYHYKVQCVRYADGGREEYNNEVFYVPFKTTFDYADRVTLLKLAKEPKSASDLIIAYEQKSDGTYEPFIV